MKQSVCAVILKGNQILGVSRKDDPTDFGLPGGKVDAGETLEEALVREVREETGLQVSNIVATFYVAVHGHYECTTYLVEVEGQIDHEAEEGVVKWVYQQQLEEGGFGDYNKALFNSTPYQVMVGAQKIKRETYSRLSHKEAIKNALERGGSRRKELIEQNQPYFTVEEVAEKLNLSSAEIEQRIRERSLLSVTLENGETRLPTWQLPEDQIIAGLDLVLNILPDYGWAADLLFFTTEHHVLDGATPLEALLKGEVDKVKYCASIQWQHGGS